MADEKMFTILILSILCLLVVWFIWRQVYLFYRSKRALQTTKEWMDIGQEIIALIIESQKRKISKKEIKSLIQKEERAWKKFLKYHPHCDDERKHHQKLKSFLGN